MAVTALIREKGIHTMVIKDGLKRLYVGKLVRDPEFSTFGSKGYPKMRTAIAYDKEGVINVNALFAAVDAWRGVQKGDYAIVSGTLSNYEGKDGNKRWFLEADFVTADLSTIYRRFAEQQPPTDISGFKEITDDDLPFD